MSTCQISISIYQKILFTDQKIMLIFQILYIKVSGSQGITTLQKVCLLKLHHFKRPSPQALLFQHVNNLDIQQYFVLTLHQIIYIKLFFCTQCMFWFMFLRICVLFCILCKYMKISQICINKSLNETWEVFRKNYLNPSFLQGFCRIH